MIENRAVLASINPLWCLDIVRGDKTVELRKTVPKIPVPFKCYIYATKPKSVSDFALGRNDGVYGLVISASLKDAEKNGTEILSGKIIGEFICNRVFTVVKDNKVVNEEALKSSLVAAEKAIEYGNGKPVYGWNISELKIYSQPVDLSVLGFKRAPQSWLYTVEIPKEKKGA